MADEPNLQNDIATMDFEDALAALEEIVRQLEGGKIRLGEAVEAYEKGVKLKLHCEARLNEAKAKVDRIAADGTADGTIAAVPAGAEWPGGAE
ncbi:MAG: exodeoxyribonuclease VII small subunit [Alphaproteobacteria bacterium]|nr:exodeoxyribonuclease VII small subunit [Alphaproteobacteria bacterium]MBF0128984.1 exodeoxyribonuclease VII small subunit [Alphaproteobacteria bacterium]